MNGRAWIIPLMNPDKRMVKGGVIGLGVGMSQARAVHASTQCELAWICDFDRAKLDKAASEFPGVKRTVNFEDVIEDPSVDFVCIASYDEYHRDQITASINKSKHVYVEKPMCLSKDEALDIRRSLKTNPQISLSSNLVLRTCPLFQKVKQRVESGETGQAYHMEADYFWGRTEKLISGWRSQAWFYSIILGAAVHMVDLVCWIKNQKPCFVQSLGSNFISRGTPQRFNDFSVFLLLFDDGSTAKIAAHGGCVHPHFHSFKLFGTRETFLHELGRTVWIKSNNPESLPVEEKAAYPAKEKRNETLLSFVDAMRNGGKPIVAQEDVFDVISICLAAENAMETTEMIEIDYL
jgi:predicted dehydrogenase